MDEAGISYEFACYEIEGDVLLDPRARTSIDWSINPSSSLRALFSKS